MFSSNLRIRYAVRLAITGAAAASSAALAQISADTTDKDNKLEEIVITGSRIQGNPNDVSVAPIATLTAADISKSGLVRLEDLLNTLPQVVPESTSGQSISSTGIATVSLRGLGSQRTLVLINGRRVEPGGSPFAVGSADLNQIPAAMVERVDVLTGGASSTYGADAVAGVVNFIMNTHFEGIRLNFAFGQNMYQQGNELAQSALVDAGQPVPGNFTGGQDRDWSFTAGANFADGKGNATVYATYLNTSPVVGTQLDYAGCTLNTADSPSAQGKPWKPVTCGGSATSATGHFLLLGATANSSYATLVEGTVDKTTGLFRHYTTADDYNYGALSYAQREAQRWTTGAFLNYDINQNINVYSETMYARNTSTAQYGPSGLYQYGEFSISCSNPLLTPSELAALCNPATIAANQSSYGGTGNDITMYIARRSVESGGRTDNYSSDSIRQVIGMKGGWGDAWTYDLYGQYGISNFADDQGGYLGQQQLDNALDVVKDPATGAPVCESVLNKTDLACVPWNIWQKGGVTPQQVQYLSVQSTLAANATEYVVNGSLTGDLGKYGVKLPTARSPIVANLGAEYRQEHFSFSPDYVFENGLASGGGGASPAINAGFHVNEIFVETKAPLIDQHTGAYHLGFEGGYRYSDYSSGFKTNTYKLGLEWAPIEDLKLRASYNRAVRAPNVSDLYQPTVLGGGNGDPCWGTTPLFTSAECALTGLNPSQYGRLRANPSGGINTTLGGNPNLRAETAGTYTLGFVLQPLALHDLVLSVDYFHIAITDTIGALTTDTILRDCATTGVAQFCDWIHRDPKTGSLWENQQSYVVGNAQNIGLLKTAGFDIEGRYSRPIGTMGRLLFSFTGSRMNDSTTQPTTVAPSWDCTGLFGAVCGNPLPHWKHVFQADWITPWSALALTGRWRYTGPVTVDAASPNPQLNYPYQPGFGHIGGYDYIDLSASISWGPTLSFRLGANNVFAKEPPIVLSGNLGSCAFDGCNDNTWVGVYDTLGRYVYAHITAQF